MAKAPHTYHHIVPQCYLKNFAIKGNGGVEFVYVFDKKQNKSYPQAIGKIAGVDDFYTISEGFDNNFSDNKIIEKEYLCDMVESKFSLRLKQTIDTINRGERLSSEIKDGLAVHIAIQFLRTKEVREKNEKLLNHIMPQVIDSYKKEQKDPEIAKFDISYEYDPAFYHFRSSFGNKDVVNEYAERLSSNYWNFFYSQYPVYYTSSFPIIVCSHDRNVDPLCFGLAQYGAELTFPISPNIMLVIWDREFFKDKAQTDGNIINATDKEIRKFNWMRYLFAEKIYSQTDDFTIVNAIHWFIGQHGYLKF